MLKVIEFAFVGYPVTDMTRARRFYEGTLNLTPATVFDHDGRQWVEYEVGPHVLGITNMAAEQWKPSADGPSVALEVENFDEAIAHLRAEGTRFVLEPFDSPVCRTAIISDPDGNSIAIHKRNAQ
jgi:predicted enzyme related to lactoylglutathione lyase